jgi:hypothetical protein
MNFSFWLFLVPSEVTCINGGIFDEERAGCVCPSGFGGPTCEEGINYSFATIGTDTKLVICEYSGFQFCVISVYTYMNN